MSKFLVLEFGSKSIKIHRRTSAGEFQKTNVHWSVGHEVYREGNISAASRRLVTKVIDALTRRGFSRRAMIVIATGAVRDAPDREEFLSFLRNDLKVEVRVLSGREEASLLAQGFLSKAIPRPSFGIDIGGGSLEMVFLDKDRTALRHSLPLGVIRLHYLGSETRRSSESPPGAQSGRGFNHRIVADFIVENLREALLLKLSSLHGTGGPVKAVAKVLKDDTIRLGPLRELEERTLREGPPASLSEERQLIFLPGVMVLRRLLEHAEAESIVYQRIPIGQIFLERFLSSLHDGRDGEHDDEHTMRKIQGIRITKLHYHSDFLPRPPAPQAKAGDDA